MEALSDDVMRVLAFIHQAERGGGAATHEAVNAFAAQPTPPPPEWLSAGLGAAHWAFEASDVAQWLIEIGLAHEDPYHVVLTRLGSAMLRGAQFASTTALILQPNDPLSYPQLVARLSGGADSLIADPYIRLNDLHQLIADTSVERILTSANISEPDLRSMAALSARSARKIKVRVAKADSWHDRYVVRHEELWQLGASVNGLHRNVTALLPVTDPAVAKAMRAYVEQLWANAQNLVTLFGPDEPSSVEEDHQAVKHE